MSARKKRIVAWAIGLTAVAALLIGSEFLITRQVESIISTAVKKQFRLTKEPYITVVSHPILPKLAVGRIDRIKIAAEKVKGANLIEFERVSLNASNLRFDTGDWVGRKKLTVKGVDSVETSVVISEKELNKYLETLLPGATVRLLNGKIRYHGKLGFFMTEKKLDVGGRIELTESDTIRFITDKEDIAALPVAKDIKDYLTDALAVEYPIPDLPGGLTVSDIKVTKGRITITGELTEFDFITGAKE